MDEEFLRGPYFGDVGRVADGALENRNRFIEWAHGIVVAILFGALVAQTIDTVLAWFAAAFVAAVVMPLFSIAVIQHGYFVRYNDVRRAILDWECESDEAEKKKRMEYAFDMVKVCDLGGQNTRTRPYLVWSVFKLGFGYLMVAADLAFAWFSVSVVYELFTHGRAAETTMALLGIIGVGAVVLRELYFLGTTRLLRYAGFRDYGGWLKNRP